MGFSFGRERRIRRRADFLRVQAEGERVSAGHFVLLVAAGPARDAPSRLGLVVTKKVGNAVKRARIKRLCRECFRTWPDLVPAGIDLVVVARGGAHELGLRDVRAEWERARAQLAKKCRAALAAREKAGAAPPTASSSAAPRDPAEAARSKPRTS